MEDIESIDNKYIILEKKGRGASSKVFVVKPFNSEEKFAAKVLKVKDTIKDIKEMENLFDNEIKILSYIKNNKITNSYITNLKDNGIGEIKRNYRPKTINKYLVLDYAEKGNLFKYIYLPERGLEEKYSKLIFYKILNGVKSLQSVNICHRDIKLENILLDNNYNPKICDFGFATFNSDKLLEPLGTRPYAAPEIIKNKPYNGFKIDIFSLGATLFTLVIGFPAFFEASSRDKNYIYIKFGLKTSFWNSIEKSAKLKGITLPKLSNEFEKLYFKMVSDKPDKRPNIDKILDNKWFQDIKKLNKKEIEDLEIEIKKEFEKREKIIKQILENKMEIEEEESSQLGNFRSIEDDIKEYFAHNLKPKLIDNEKGMNNCIKIKIKGNCNPAYFMNKLMNKIYENLGNQLVSKKVKNH